ncbi:MAG: hypothetical protein ACRDGB_07230 [Candidatus Limnocylindria bacterium]
MSGTHRLSLLSLFIISALLAACGAAEVAEITPSPTPPTTASPTPAAQSPSTTPQVTPSASASPADEGCELNVVSPPADWQVATSDEFGFSIAYPPDWENLSAGITYQPGMLFDAETFEQTGLPDGADVDAGVVLQSPDGVPTVAVFAVDGVTSTTEEVYERQLAELESEPFSSEVLSTDTTGCLAGEPALGAEVSGFNTELDLETGEVVPLDEEISAQYWMVVRDGTVYFIQWIDDPSPDLAALDRMLVSWTWSESGTDEPATGSGTIANAGMALEPTPSGGDLDTSTFQSSFPADASAIYVIYDLSPGSDTTVNFTWRQDGAVIITQEFDWTPDTTSAWANITPPSGGFEPGSYEVEIELTGERRTLAFTIEDP